MLKILRSGSFDDSRQNQLSGSIFTVRMEHAAFYSPEAMEAFFLPFRSLSAIDRFQ